MLVEVLFGVVFAGTLIDFLRRRDPLSREVALAFTGLASLLVVDLLRRATGDVPPLVSRLSIVLLLAQPLFTLRVVDRIRPIPRLLLPAAYLASAVTLVPLLLIPADSALVVPVAIGAFVVFVVLGVAGALYLALESRRRSGSARIRMLVAAASTALLAIAILSLLARFAGPQAGEIAGRIARALAIVAAIGYVVAFVPPRFLRRAWQNGAGYRLGRRLLETAVGADPEVAWRRYVELALELTGADAAAVRGVDGQVRAAIGIAPPPVSSADVARLLHGPAPGVDRSPGEVGGPWEAIAEGIGARYLTIVRIAARGTSPAILLLYSTRRSLFRDDDRELLAALGAQAAILAERASLAGDLRVTVEQLRAASAAKSDFLASMSHELRTPLNAIIGFSELMRMEPATDERVTVPVEWVDHVARAGQHLLDLINDVLDLAKVEAGRLELDTTPFDGDQALVEWVGGVRPLADRKRIRLAVVGEAGAIVADRGRLRQVVYNLLSNAIKFTPEGGEVRLELERSASEVVVAVHDTGIGIAPEDQAAVFEEFRQVGSPSERQPGTGLGLALTRRLVEAHGGRIELESAPGEGSRFRVCLPQPASEHLDVEEPDALVDPGEALGTSVLVIEDDPSAVRLLVETLDGGGWDVLVAGDGERGLALARERRPDAIVLDVQLPGMDGWDVLRALKSDRDLEAVPVLMLTVVDERDIGLALGAADYLVKPVERTALLATLGRYALTNGAGDGAVRVLVVDDEPAAAELIAAALEPEGFTVVRAHGGREGLAKAIADPPDVVISDLVMPDLDGFGMIAALKADPRTRDAPILVVTGHTISAAEKDRLNGDILGIVAKGPAVADGLLGWVRRVVRRQATNSAA